jgi:hypothetical protein
MHGLLYENQEDLSDEDLRSYAVRLELDLARFDEDLAGHRHAERVQENRLAGERDGVRGTPGVFLNGVPYDGRLETEALLRAVEEAADGAGGPRTYREVRRVGPADPFGGLDDPIAEICSEERGVNNNTLRRVVELAVEIAREGREGRKIGTLFAVGDHEAVLVRSRPLVLDPLAGHPDEVKHVKDPDMRETVKELAQLDGAFVVADDGVVVSAARYLDAASGNLELPLGLGSRHMAAASITRETGAMAVVVSESSVVRVFDDGKIVAEIIPEFWMMSQFESAAAQARALTRSTGTYPDAPRRGSSGPAVSTATSGAASTVSACGQGTNGASACRPRRRRSGVNRHASSRPVGTGCAARSNEAVRCRALPPCAPSPGRP